MTTTAQRESLIKLIAQACQGGARRHQACNQIGITSRTLQRWLHPFVRPASVLAPQQAQQPQASGEAAPAVARRPNQPCTVTLAGQTVARAKPLCADRRQSELRQGVTPHNKLTPQECEDVLAVINSREYKDFPPSQIVPRLADQGLYLASESTMQRLLRSRHQNTHRRSARPAKKRQKPFALKATVVNQVYTWDITYLPTQIKGQYFYLYVFVDIFSRFIVGAQVFESERADLAADLLKDICERHGIAKDQVHLHSDNGAPMKGQTMLAMMQELGVVASRSRPSVSNDNPYSESLFGTLKYRPLMPLKPFESIEQARLWAIGLVAIGITCIIATARSSLSRPISVILVKMRSCCNSVLKFMPRRVINIHSAGRKIHATGAALQRFISTLINKKSRTPNHQKINPHSFLLLRQLA